MDNNEASKAQVVDENLKDEERIFCPVELYVSSVRFLASDFVVY